MAQIILTTTGWLAKKFTDILSNMRSALVAAYVLMLLVWYCSEYKLILVYFLTLIANIQLFNWITSLLNRG